MEASAIGSILLARVLLKIGGYGLFLFSSFCFGFYKIGCLFLLFCLIGAFLVLLQRDIKKIIAFTSIFHILSFLFLTWAHVNFSCFGGLFMLFIHRVLSAFFFIVVREVYYLTFTRNFFLVFSVLSKLNEILLFLLLLLLIFNLGSPPLLRFFYELLFSFFVFILNKQTLRVLFFVFILNLVILLKYFLVFFQGKNNRSFSSTINYRLISLC